MKSFKNGTLKENLNRIMQIDNVLTEGSLRNEFKDILRKFIHAIHTKDTTVVDQRSLDNSSDGEILAQFILADLQGARIELEDMDGFSRIIKNGL